MNTALCESCIKRKTMLCPNVKDCMIFDNKPYYLGQDKVLEELQQKEKIIKEVREILNQDKASASFNTAERNALEILDKGE